MSSGSVEDGLDANENEMEHQSTKKKSHRDNKKSSKIMLNKTPSTTKKAKLIAKSG